MIKIKGFSHSAVRITDAERATNFYESVLGLKKSFEMDGWAEFNGGGNDEAAIGISNGQHTPKEHGATIVLRVDDIERERKRLEATGVKFEGKTEEIPGMVKLAIFRDPSGNRLQLCGSGSEGECVTDQRGDKPHRVSSKAVKSRDVDEGI